MARLADDMMTVSDIHEIETRRKEYSEGPIFFKRKGIYYYLYTIGGDENYEYYYRCSEAVTFGKPSRCAGIAGHAPVAARREAHRTHLGAVGHT